jgi:hypothetical protein
MFARRKTIFLCLSTLVRIEEMHVRTQKNYFPLSINLSAHRGDTCSHVGKLFSSVYQPKCAMRKGMFARRKTIFLRLSTLVSCLCWFATNKPLSVLFCNSNILVFVGVAYSVGSSLVRNQRRRA